MKKITETIINKKDLLDINIKKNYYLYIINEFNKIS